jgi:chromate transporter
MSTPPSPHPSQTMRVTPLNLFLIYTRITLSSFGGAIFWSRRMLVDRLRWLTEHEFVELLAVAQLLPGATGVSLAVMIGHRFGGWSGAAASLMGFFAAPCIVIACLGALYQRYGNLAPVQQAMSGMSIVAVGLLIATGVRMATVLQRKRLPWLFALLAFLGVGVMRWPLLAILAALAPCAIFAAWRVRR